MNKTGVHGHRTRFLSIAKAPSYHSSYSPRCDQACRWWSCGTTENVPNKKRIMWTSFFHDDVTTDSSVGRAGDCRLVVKAVISRSLVQIRLGGNFFLWQLTHRGVHDMVSNGFFLRLIVFKTCRPGTETKSKGLMFAITSENWWHTNRQ